MKLNISSPCDATVLLLDTFPSEMKIYGHTKTHMWVMLFRVLQRNRTKRVRVYMKRFIIRGWFCDYKS